MLCSRVRSLELCLVFSEKYSIILYQSYLGMPERQKRAKSCHPMARATQAMLQGLWIYRGEGSTVTEGLNHGTHTRRSVHLQ